MIRNAFRFAIVLAVGAGCSHQEAVKQTPQPPPQPVAQAPAPPPPKQEPVQEAAYTPDNAVYFDFDSSMLRDDARPQLEQLAEKLKADKRARVRIEGNCDERGTNEYNLALGAHRAEAAKKYLESLGIPASRIQTVSYGSEKPKYQGHDESAWSKNRRDDFVMK